ncbi:aminomethyltransferase family protein [Mixta intestinalis]|jgi:glycine cleavage system aminomethyltransferase T|uniref:Aminomethyltransferase n=1 Tax=Mixta intestinalis TaxID=1615494 RepID=A0A6P1PVL6_9GAMM|nr:aminomethyltransferase family protein [Mixta intestinalis]QHM70556.1 Aminomethyltransferase [Mixta intestinalis]
MNTLHDLHIKHHARMGQFNDKTVPASYHDDDTEYRAVRENALLVDYSHMSIVSVMGEDAWALVNHMVSADVSTIRDEQGIYSLVLNEDGTICGDVYILCADEGYYLLSENMTASAVIARLEKILEKAEELDIQDTPQICTMEEACWGAALLEGPYSWEVLAEVYGFDIIGLPYHEFMNTDDGLMVFRCGKHGEFGYLMIGEQGALAALWQQLLDIGEKYRLQTGGLDYQKTVRIENPAWDTSIYAAYSRNPVELQLQWAVQYDKEDFIGKEAVEEYSRSGVECRVVGMLPVAACTNMQPDDCVLVDGKVVGKLISTTFSPARCSFIALALLDEAYAWSDIEGFTIRTRDGDVAAMTHNLPFLYNLSMLVSPTEHSFIDASKSRSAL